MSRRWIAALLFDVNELVNLQLWLLRRSVFSNHLEPEHKAPDASRPESKEPSHSRSADADLTPARPQQKSVLSLVCTVGCLIDLLLRSVAQTYAMNHPVCGALLIIGLLLSEPMYLAGFSVLGAACANAAAYVFGSKRMEDADVQLALYGYDGVLAALAVPTFLTAITPGWQVFTAVICATIAGTLRCSVGRVLKPLSLPPLTLAFCLTAISMMLVYDHHSDIQFISTPGAAGPTAAATAAPPTRYSAIDGALFMRASLKGIGQIMFITSWPGGLLAFIGLAGCSRRAAIGALVGAMIGNGLAVALLPTTTNAVVYNRLVEGLYAYNPSLTCCVLGGGTIPIQRPGWTWRDCLLLPLLGAALAFPLHLTWQSLLATPVMTVPFITTTWIFYPAVNAFSNRELRESSGKQPTQPVSVEESKRSSSSSSASHPLKDNERRHSEDITVLHLDLDSADQTEATNTSRNVLTIASS